MENIDLRKAKRDASKLLFSMHRIRIAIGSSIISILIKSVWFSKLLGDTSIIKNMIVYFVIFICIYGIFFIIYHIIVPKLISESFINKVIARGLMKVDNEKLKQILEDLKKKF